MPTKPSKMLNGLKNKDNTTKLWPLLRKPNKSSLMPSNHPSCKKLKNNKPLSPKFLPTWPNTLNQASKENHGTLSSTSCHKSLLMPPFKPTNQLLTELLLFATN